MCVPRVGSHQVGSLWRNSSCRWKALIHHMEAVFPLDGGDRRVHHAVISELTGTSVRADEAESARKKETKTTTTATTTTQGPQANEVNGEM
jgi:hypothetical protein